MKPRYEIVLATHSEDLSWVLYLPQPRKYLLTVSNSNNRPNVLGADRVVHRENFGREAGHYLNHIVNDYDDLAETTVFMQGDPWPHAAMYGNPCIMLELLFGTPQFRYDICYLGKEYVKGHALFAPGSEHHKLLTRLWGEHPIPPGIPISIGAQFYVKRDLVHRMPREHYARLLEEGRDKTVYHADPLYTLAHTLEGCWGCVFDHFSGTAAI